MKNILLFLPMFFNRDLIHLDNLWLLIISFFSFSFISSSIYCINDIIDIDFDKKHIRKKLRPIASGVISKTEAKIIAFILFFSSFALAILFINVNFIVVIALYFTLNILYSFLLKNIILIDVICISLSFILRIYAGGTANNTPLTYWILSLVFLLSLYLAISKRKDEVFIFTSTNIMVRKNINRYSKINLDLITKSLIIVILSLYTAYTLLAKSMQNNHYAIFTVIFVMLGLWRYEYLLKMRTYYASPTRSLLKDKLMQATLIFWILSYYILIYK